MLNLWERNFPRERLFKRSMKTHILVPLFAALVFTGMARSENPGQPQPGGPLAGGPMAEHLKQRLEELRRAGKHEEAGRLERHAKEMWEHQGGNPQGERRGNPPGERREESHRGTSPANPGERAAHLAEAAKHLRAAGINVSPEVLEKLGHRSDGKTGNRPSGSPGDHPSSGQGRLALPSKGGPAPGAGSPIDALHGEIRALARQVQELRGMVQQRRGGDPSGGNQGRGVHSPNDGEQHGDKARGEQHGNRSAAPGASREHRDGPVRPQGDKGDNRPRGEARPSNPPRNPPAPANRPQGDAPDPSPGR